MPLPKVVHLHRQLRLGRAHAPLPRMLTGNRKVSLSMTTYVTNYIKSCARCGSAFKQRRGLNAKFCTSQCMRWADRDRERDLYEARKSRRMAELATTPLHEMYPGMMDVLEWAQMQRPSWADWRLGRAR